MVSVATMKPKPKGRVDVGSRRLLNELLLLLCTGFRVVIPGHFNQAVISAASMNEKLDRYLHEYSVDLDFWSSDMGDTHEKLGAREILETNRASLTAAMRHHLDVLDAKAKRLLATYRGPETWDVTMLRDIVRLAESAGSRRVDKWTSADREPDAPPAYSDFR